MFIVAVTHNLTHFSYIEWSTHEPEMGDYHFNGPADIFGFIKLAKEEGLLVIIRPGPYIDAERDMVNYNKSQSLFNSLYCQTGRIPILVTTRKSKNEAKNF